MLVIEPRTLIYSKAFFFAFAFDQMTTAQYCLTYILLKYLQAEKKVRMIFDLVMQLKNC